MKTIKMWLETLPEPYKRRALTNLISVRRETMCDKLHRAIYSGFMWADTPEGYTYWATVRDRAERGDFDTIEMIQENKKTEAINFYQWTCNQVIAGRTTERLWEDYKLQSCKQDQNTDGCGAVQATNG